MAENVPPPNSTTTQAATNNTADQPGRPYYESLRASLRTILDKKRKLDEALSSIEDNIFKAEGAYLEETANSGNIVRGFDGWVKGVQVSTRGADDRRRGRVRDEDRVFSRSSVGWMKAQEGTDSNPTSHAPTPTASFAPQLGSAVGLKAGNKKKRPTLDEEEEGKALKRGKISYARD
jgi:chromatin modification-related protein EAF6